MGTKAREKSQCKPGAVFTAKACEASATLCTKLSSVQEQHHFDKLLTRAVYPSSWSVLQSYLWEAEYSRWALQEDTGVHGPPLAQIYWSETSRIRGNKSGLSLRVDRVCADSLRFFRFLCILTGWTKTHLARKGLPYTNQVSLKPSHFAAWLSHVSSKGHGTEQKLGELLEKV